MSEEIIDNQTLDNGVKENASNTAEDEHLEVNEEVQNQTVEEEQKNTETNDYSNVNTSEQASEILESKGFDYNALTEEFEANGDLLAETRAKLEKQGITKEIIDTYIEGQKAIIQRQMEDISTVVGGMENMSIVIEWAKNNLSDEEKQSIDAIHDPVIIKSILKDLENRMKTSEGYIPQVQLQGNAGGYKGNYFQSMAEVEEAINDPKYSKDPVYRAKIAQKITASREAGTIEIK